MTCDCEITIDFADTDTIEFVGGNGAPISANYVGPTGGGTGCCNNAIELNIVNGELVVTVTDDNGPVSSNAVPVLVMCAETGGNGLTGTRVTPRRIIGCEKPSLNGQKPETAGFLAAGFPDGWEQDFADGETGDETWIVRQDTQGANQWHQIA